MNRDTQQRLANYAETPPAAVWQGLVAALDDVPEFATRVHQFVATPPPALWHAIETQLPSQPARVVPLRTKLFKYAMAAAILAAVAAGSIFYLTHSNAPSLASQNQPAQAPKAKSGTATGASETEGNTGTQQPIASLADMATAGVAHFAPRVQIVNNARPIARLTAIREREKNIVNTELANRYMIATTQTGTVVRLPKKAYTAYACADRFVNANCKEVIATIQTKMAASTRTDFTDLMYLLQNLQEN